jgi:hypothetical protein
MAFPENSGEKPFFAMNAKRFQIVFLASGTRKSTAPAALTP